MLAEKNVINCDGRVGGGRGDGKSPFLKKCYGRKGDGIEQKTEPGQTARVGGNKQKKPPQPIGVAVGQHLRCGTCIQSQRWTTLTSADPANSRGLVGCMEERGGERGRKK